MIPRFARSEAYQVRRAARPWVVALGALLGACTPAVPHVVSVPSSPPDFRIVAGATGQPVSMDHMVETLARADVVFFGEQHDDPVTHRAESIVLERIAGAGRPVTISLEMFERDVQPVMDAYLAGRTGETEFGTGSRPWPNYATDYRPLVEMARMRGWRVIAANVPRSMASAVGRRGLSVLDSLPSTERVHAARDIICPDDAYRARFMDQMRSHSSGSGPAPQAGDTLPTAVAQRFYLAQCVKDETMAESIVEARRRGLPNGIVVHFSGAFHSDFRQGVVDRVRRREAGLRASVITAVPVSDPAAATMSTHAGRADFIIFTRTP